VQILCRDDQKLGRRKIVTLWPRSDRFRTGYATSAPATALLSWFDCSLDHKALREGTAASNRISARPAPLHGCGADEKRQGGDGMTGTTTSETVRKFATRILAAGAMLAIYSMGTLGVTGVVLTGASTAAQAQWRGRGWRGRGWRGRGWRGRGWRGWRGWRGRGRLLCRHRSYSSRRGCWWVR